MDFQRRIHAAVRYTVTYPGQYAAVTESGYAPDSATAEQLMDAIEATARAREARNAAEAAQAEADRAAFVAEQESPQPGPRAA
jgi:hypothetical protein